MDKNQSNYRDFIPEGEGTGPYGEGGYIDFVPEPEPRDVEKVSKLKKPQKSKKNTKKKKGGK